MRTEKVLSIALVLVLLASAVPLAVAPAAAYETKIPCEAGGNNELTKDELVNAILPYMLGEGAYTLDEVGDAAWVYVYWDGKPKTVVDSAKRTVTVYRPVKRLVVCFPQALEALRSLKMPKDRIVGLAKDYPPYDLGFFPEIGDIPSVGDRWSPDVEKILYLYPDAVILFPKREGMGAELGAVQDALESAGITVLNFGGNDLRVRSEEMIKLGYIFDKSEEAEEFLDWHDNILNSIEEKVNKIPEEDKPKVYFMPSFTDDVYYAYGMYAYIEMAGGKDIFADQPGEYTPVDSEGVINQTPEIIVRVASATAGGYGVDDPAKLKALRDEIMNRPELQNVTAVKEGRVYIITDHLLSFFGNSGGRQFAQIAYQAKWFQPELFKDLDPKALHQEYLTRFQGLDIDLDEQGVFVYHPEEHPDGR